MLIEYSVSNFRSFSTEQTLSLVASKLTDGHKDRVLEFSNSKDLRVLNSAILLGKNGSGKSSLVRSMAFLRRLVIRSAQDSQRGEPITFSPNLIDKEFVCKDTYFRVLFSVRDRIYQFEFSHNGERITYEKLSFSDTMKRFKKFYERSYLGDHNGYSYSFGEDLSGEKSLWQKSTRENALFLSTAIQLNSTSLKEPFDWLSGFLRIYYAHGNLSPRFTAKQCEDLGHKKRVIGFLKGLDIDVHDIEVQDEELDTSALREAFNPEFIKKIEKEGDLRARKVRFVHKNSASENVSFDLDDESTGTQALFALAGPLFDTLTNGYCLVIDEINTNLHPLVFHTLINAFSDPSLNPKRAQLIFTSHDTSLLRDTYFRRDQVWFVEKNGGCSELIPLSDYSPRKGEAIERGYLKGRYGGVPYISSALRSTFS